MNLKEQAEIIAAAIAGKDLIGRSRDGGVPIRFSPGPDLRFNFQDYTYELADAKAPALSIEAQARILGAASLGEQIETTLCPASHDSIWRPLTFPHAFDFTRLAYRIAEEKPKTRILHQYIFKNGLEDHHLTASFYENERDAAAAVGPKMRVIGPAAWTRIEVQT